MTFFMFKGIAAKLFISTKIVTTLVFPGEIETVIAGWNKQEVFKYKSHDSKVLVIRANRSDIDTNMTVITTAGIYDFDVKVDQNKPHRGTVEVKNGFISKSFAMLKETDIYKAFEGESSILIVPKSSMTLNGEPVKNQEILPRGIPIFINGKREIY